MSSCSSGFDIRSDTNRRRVNKPTEVFYNDMLEFPINELHQINGAYRGLS